MIRKYLIGGPGYFTPDYSLLYDKQDKDFEENRRLKSYKKLLDYSTNNTFNLNIPSNIRVESGITNAFNEAKLNLRNYYNSNEYNDRLNRAKGNSLLSRFYSTDNIANNLINRLNNVNLFFDLGETSVVNSPSGGYRAYTNNSGVTFNKSVFNPKKSPGNIYGTAVHELGHYTYHPLPTWAILYNNSLINLNPNLSPKYESYYGDPNEIRARGLDVLLSFKNSKYKTLEEFIDNNLKYHGGLTDLYNTFKDRLSLLNYLNNFVYNNPKNEEDYNLYAKQGGKMNILQFLKNGSGIKIKENLKGNNEYITKMLNEIWKNNYQKKN